MDNIVLHIGLHKTATGTLQRQFFPSCADLQLLTTSEPRMREFVELVTRKDPIYFDPDKALQTVRCILSDEKPNVLSNESFSGPPYAGLLEFGLDHRSSVVANLKAVFPNARIILVLRRQDALARSLYRQYLKSGGTRTARRFFGMANDDRPPLMSLDRFCFSPYVGLLMSTFPKGVLLLCFEEFVQSRESFLTKLTKFIGVECPDPELKRENATRLGPLGMEVSRLFNHLFRSHLNPAGLLPGIPLLRAGQIRLVNPMELFHDNWPGKAGNGKGEIFSVAMEIFDRAREDNHILDRRYGLDLHKYAYY